MSEYEKEKKTKGIVLKVLGHYCGSQISFQNEDINFKKLVN